MVPRQHLVRGGQVGDNRAALSSSSSILVSFVSLIGAVDPAHLTGELTRGQQAGRFGGPPPHCPDSPQSDLSAAPRPPGSGIDHLFQRTPIDPGGHPTGVESLDQLLGIGRDDPFNGGQVDGVRVDQE